MHFLKCAKLFNNGRNIHFEPPLSISLIFFKLRNSTLGFFKIVLKVLDFDGFKAVKKRPPLFFFNQKLSVYSTDVRGNYSSSILSSCPLVEKLTLCNCDSLTDDDLFDVLEKNPMDNCKDLCLLLAPYLTLRSICTVMTCCQR